MLQLLLRLCDYKLHVRGKECLVFRALLHIHVCYGDDDGDDDADDDDNLDSIVDNDDTSI